MPSAQGVPPAPAPSPAGTDIGAAGAAGVAAGAPTGAGAVRRMVWRLTPLPPLPPAEPGRLAGMRVLLLAQEGETATAVERELRGLGAQVRVYATAAEAGPPGGTGAPVDAVVDLTAGPAAPPVGDGVVPPAGTALAGAWRGPLHRTVAVLRDQYADWAAETSARRMYYLAVTYLGGGMGQHPDDDLAQPLGGLWAGLAKTLHREFPNCNARVVDVGRSELGSLPGIVAAELGRPGELEVGYRDGRRLGLSPVARDVGAPAVALGPEDSVLISGGGRGIGWQLALTLAGAYGVRVVVTGREPFPAEDAPWFGVGEAELRVYEKELWAQRRSGRPLSAIRGDIERTRRAWELAANITGARAAGLRIDYAQCDFTDPVQVRALLDREGAALTGVVHNAGVDTAAKLTGKTDEQIERTVRVKVDGFVNLFAELAEARLKFFCNVGSLTGRLGGMVGQLEYAAANEALARLGRWAQRLAPYPVMTLAWPTWDRVGLITNFSAALRYMAAVDVTEGVGKWVSELRAGSRGEVTFVGRLGAALAPGQATGYPVVSDLPGFAETYPKIFHLGEVSTYEPHSRLVSRVSFDLATAPVLADFLVDGAPALPVSLLAESAVRGAEWIVPGDFPELRVRCLERLVVPLGLLRLDGGGTLLEREVRGRREGRTWVVEVRFRRPGEDWATAPECGVRIVYDSPDVRSPAPPRPVARTTTLSSGAPTLRWRSSVIPAAHWQTGHDGRLTAGTRACAAKDLWATALVPATLIPVSALENVFRACTRHGDRLSVTVDPLFAGRITLHAPEPAHCLMEGDPRLGVWRVRDAASGDPVMTVTELPGPPGPVAGG